MCLCKVLTKDPNVADNPARFTYAEKSGFHENRKSEAMFVNILNRAFM
jgi:hypothetical protein